MISHRASFIIHWIIMLPIFLVYTLFWSLPFSFWFQSNSILVSDAPFGSIPSIIEDRIIKRSFYGSYSATTRRMDDNSIVCSVSGFVMYRGGLDQPRQTDLLEWSNYRLPCAFLRPGTYYLETCRTVIRPAGELLPVPEKTQCWYSNPFRIFQPQRSQKNG